MPRSLNPRVFVSYSHADDAFARDLASRLSRAGARVWIDERFLTGGQPLTETFLNAIRSSEYFIVVLSPNASNSKWVLKETQVALELVSVGNDITIIPIIRERCKIPDLLQDVVAEDFSSRLKRWRGLPRLMRSLRLYGSSPEIKNELLQHMHRHTSLANAVDELAKHSDLRSSTVQAIMSSGIPVEELDTFWLLLVQRFAGIRRRHSAAITARLVEAHDLGHAAVEFAVSQGALDEDGRRWVAGAMGSESASAEAIKWAHERFWPNISSELEYNQALRKQLATALEHCSQQVIGRVTRGERGPDSTSVDRMFDLVRYASDPAPFLAKWRQWIVDGYFDNRGIPGQASAALLYSIYNEAIRGKAEHLFDLIEQTMKHTLGLLCSDDVDFGVHHLKCMISAKFTHSSRMANMIALQHHNLNPAQQEKVMALEEQLRFVNKPR